MRLTTLSIVSLLLACSSCVGEAEFYDYSFDLEEAYPGEVGDERTGVLSLPTVEGEEPREIEVTYQVIDGDYVFQGDILLPPEHVHELDEDHRTQRQGLATVTAQMYWPGGVIPYRIDPRLPNPDRVHQAVQHWNEQTPIQLVQHTHQADFVTFRPSDGCSAHLGRVGGEQFVNLANECDLGATIHEIGHTAGLWHEQSRSDRDQHVAIRWQNIIPGHESNFKTYGEQGFGGNDVGYYDAGSIMHYSAYAFSRNGAPTIVRRSDGQAIHSNRAGLSRLDVDGVRHIYGPKLTGGPDGKICGGAQRYSAPPRPARVSVEQAGQIVRLYCAFFDRVPDDGGMRHWMNSMAGGTTSGQIAQAFASSAEFQQRYGSISDTRYVKLLYWNVLDRQPDAGGHRHWEATLLWGMNRGEVMLHFSDSAEYRNRTDSIWR